MLYVLSSFNWLLAAPPLQRASVFAPALQVISVASGQFRLARLRPVQAQYLSLVDRLVVLPWKTPARGFSHSLPL